MTYEAIWEWVNNTYDLQGYFSAESLLFDVRNQFLKDGRYFPEEAEEVIKYNFQFRDSYIEMQRRQDEQKQIAEYIGGGQTMESITDEIVDDLRSPKAEILDIDVSEYATTKESVVPPDIVKFAQKQSFFYRLTSGFKSTLNRIFGKR